MQKSTATAVSKLKSAIFKEKILNITGKKGYTAAVARGIDETSNTVQLGKQFIFIMCHFQSATLPVHLFVSLFDNVHVLSYYFQR